MADYFRPLHEALLQATQRLIASNAGLVQTNQELQAIGQALAQAAEASRAAKGEEEDLRETVHRLETLLLAQSEQLRALRARLDEPGEGRP